MQSEQPQALRKRAIELWIPTILSGSGALVGHSDGGMDNTGMSLPSRFDALAWHIHEMLFGFVMAAIAGFLLTAIPNWTARQPVNGLMLGLPFWLGISAERLASGPAGANC